MTARWTEAETGEAARALRAGSLVAFPTETVYGLGALAADGRAVAAIYAAKGRPRFNPLIVHVAELSEAERIGALDARARALAGAFWPGPLTLVAPLRAGAEVAELALAGLGTVALRAPAHPLAQALLVAVGAPLVAPSANRSGSVSPTTAAHVLEGLEGRIAGVLDGGPCAVGLESSIVDLAGPQARLLRPGGLPAAAIEAALGAPLVRVGGDAAVAAPGMLASHYAPGAALRLDANAPRQGEAWLGFGADPHEAAQAVAARNLSASGDLAEAAAHLFADLRALDAALGGRGRIAVAPIPAHGLGEAIADRLRRAAAPRPTPVSR
ncbi:MAG: L-threonylcarbamoyladenylate synthase [Rubrimonas sp.]|uniref:L-threonylcarbamoyladenylate synthase n=1 Tax=Rubrimonas sp. TaxID=2036015 RepID=UPI002FDD786F